MRYRIFGPTLFAISALSLLLWSSSPAACEPWLKFIVSGSPEAQRLVNLPPAGDKVDWFLTHGNLEVNYFDMVVSPNDGYAGLRARVPAGKPARFLCGNVSSNNVQLLSVDLNALCVQPKQQTRLEFKVILIVPQMPNEGVTLFASVPSEARATLSLVELRYSDQTGRTYAPTLVLDPIEKRSDKRPVPRPILILRPTGVEAGGQQSSARTSPVREVTPTEIVPKPTEQSQRQVTAPARETQPVRVPEPPAPERPPAPVTAAIDLPGFARTLQRLRAAHPNVEDCLARGVTNARIEGDVSLTPIVEHVRLALPLVGEGGAVTFFGLPLTCIADKSCGKDGAAMTLQLRAAKLKYDFPHVVAGAHGSKVHEAVVRSALGNRLAGGAKLVECPLKDGESVFLVPGQSPVYDAADIERNRLRLVEADKAPFRSGEPLIGAADGFASIVVEQRQARRYEIILLPVNSRREPISAEDFRQLVDGEQFFFRKSGANSENAERARVEMTTTGEFKLALQAELFAEQRPVVGLPEKLVKGHVSIAFLRTEDSRYLFQVVVPDDLVRPVELRLRPVRRLYGQAIPDQTYPGSQSDCNLVADFAGGTAAVAYGRVDGAVVVHQRPGVRIAAADVQQAKAAGRLGLKTQCQTSPNVELRAIGLEFEPSQRRLVGDLVIPENRSWLLGLIAPRLGTVPDQAKFGGYRTVVQRVALDLVNALDETYQRDTGRFAAGDVISVTIDAAEAGSDLARHAISGGIARKERPGDLKLGENGGDAIVKGIQHLTAVSPEHLADVAKSYVRLHTGEELKDGAAAATRLRVLGMVVDDASQCRKWAERLASALPRVTVDLLLLDVRDETIAKAELSGCASKDRVEVQRLSLAAIEAMTESARNSLVRGALGKFVGYSANRN